MKHPKPARWDPFHELSRLQESLTRMLDEGFFRRPGESALSAWAPDVDIYETAEELVLQADMPGLSERDIDIRVENNTLTIRGERKFEATVPEDNYLRIERRYGSFTRSFSLPHTVDTERIKAEYRNGVLTIRLPKREEARPKQIRVQVTAG
jgi:HSP20 family protein